MDDKMLQFARLAMRDKRVISLVVGTSLILCLLVGFGNPTLWMTQEQVDLRDAPPVEQPAPTPEPEPVEEQPEPEVPQKPEKEVIAEQRIVSQSTDEARAHNMMIAAVELSGRIINPGEEFSFNEYVGNTETDTRYREASIVADNSIGYARGGGICQVSTALYMTALKASLDIVERHPHTLAIDYAPIGLDATVAYGTLDLVIRNNTASPIEIEVETAGQEVTLRLLGVPLDEGVSVDAVSKIINKETEDVEGEEMLFYVVETYRHFYRDGIFEKSEFLYKDTYQVVAGNEGMLSGGGTDPTK